MYHVTGVIVTVTGVIPAQMNQPPLPTRAPMMQARTSRFVSMILKYEPSSEPLLMSVEQSFLN